MKLAILNRYLRTLENIGYASSSVDNGTGDRPACLAESDESFLIYRGRLDRNSKISNSFLSLTRDFPIGQGVAGYYLNRNYRTQELPLFNGYGVELGFSTTPIQTNTRKQAPYITAMDRVLEMADQHWDMGRYMQSSPIALRRVKGSNAYLSPQYSTDGEPTCMIELLNLADTHGGKELFYRYQRELLRLGARPHWGLDLSVTTGNNGLLSKMYPKFDQWLKGYRSLNRAGTFNNRFTDRMGLSG